MRGRWVQGLRVAGVAGCRVAGPFRPIILCVATCLIENHSLLGPALRPELVGHRLPIANSSSHVLLAVPSGAFYVCCSQSHQLAPALQRALDGGRQIPRPWLLIIWEQELPTQLDQSGSNTTS